MRIAAATCTIVTSAMTHAAQQVVDAMTQWYTHLWHATYLEALPRVIHIIEVMATTVKTASILMQLQHTVYAHFLCDCTHTLYYRLVAKRHMAC
jgi:hypothetical protein